MEGDEVVEELDVYYCSKDELGAQLFVFQHPLRPEWNPYSTEDAEKIQFKPNARLLEMQVPLGGKDEDSDEDMNGKEKRDTLKLTSTDVDLKSTFYAVGYKRPRGLYLTEVEGVLQLRPDLRHLDPVEDVRVEEKPKEELTKLQAKIPKRETAAEQQRRENSYAHIARKERMEKWKSLQSSRSTSRIAEKVLEQLTTPIDKDVDMSMKRRALLSLVAPEVPGLQASVSMQTVHSKQPIPKPVEITEGVLNQLSTALDELFGSTGVANLKEVRHLLRQASENESVFHALAMVDDEVLHDAIMHSRNVTWIRGVYLRLATGSALVDPLRTILMEIVEQKDIIKRNDVISAAKAKGVKITEKLFDTIMREICVSQEGGFWTLKTGHLK